VTWSQALKSNGLAVSERCRWPNSKGRDNFLEEDKVLEVVADGPACKSGGDLHGGGFAGIVGEVEVADGARAEVGWERSEAEMESARRGRMG
jgi:hypothetical protein